MATSKIIFGEFGVPVNEMYNRVYNIECRMDKNCVLLDLRVSVHLGSFKRVANATAILVKIISNL